MALVVRIERTGGADQLKMATAAVPALKEGEVLVKQTAIGVNFIDVYHRTGLYQLPSLPAVLGMEASGSIAEVGPGVRGLKEGDRVAYAMLPVGAYVSERVVPAERMLALPKHMSDELVAASLLKGMTAHMLLNRVVRVQSGQNVLIHGAAGGLGGILAQWCRRLGARVIGTAGSAEKAPIASGYGAQHVIVGRDADFAEEVLSLTGGHGVDVAYDGIGGSTLKKSIQCVRPFGTVVSMGQAGGPIPPIDVAELGPRRSLLFARPSIVAHISDLQTYKASAEALFAVIETGLAPSVGSRYPLSAAAEAHIDLEAGRTIGSVLLIP